VKSKDIAGTGMLNYHMYPDKLQRVTLGLGYKGFNSSTNSFYEKVDNSSVNFGYHRIKANLELAFKKKNARSDKKQSLSFELLTIFQESAGNLSNLDTAFLDNGNFNLIGYEGHNTDMVFVPRIKYNLSNQRTLMPYEINAVLEQFTWEEKGQGYAKLSVEAKTKFFYKPKKGLQLRAFAGAFFYNKKGDVNSRVNGDFNLTSNGAADYWADEYYFGRSESSGFLSQQIHLNDGGFKTIFNTSSTGVGNQGLVALNLKLDLPIKFSNFLPNMKPYVDIAYLATDDNQSFSDGFFAQVGFALEMLNERIGIYLPIISTENIKSINASKKYFSKVSFMIDLNRMDPNKFLYNFDL
jgi:hypothetical protein